MQTIREFVIEDMAKRRMTMREYADFLGVTHPTVSRYIHEVDKEIQFAFLVALGRATKTDIGTLARMAAPEVAFEHIPDSDSITQRLNKLPPLYRKMFAEMIDAYLYQQQRLEDRK